jgi:hypothetical protein
MWRVKASGGSNHFRFPISDCQLIAFLRSELDWKIGNRKSAIGTQLNPLAIRYSFVLINSNAGHLPFSVFDES